MTTHFEDLPFVHTHQLTYGLIKGSSAAVGGGMGDGDDVTAACCKVNQLCLEGAAAEWPLLRKEVVAYGCPTLVRARETISPGKMPDSVLVEACGNCFLVLVGDRDVEPLYYFDVFLDWHVDLLGALTSLRPNEGKFVRQSIAVVLISNRR